MAERKNLNRTRDRISTSIIIPAYNEQDGLPLVLTRIHSLIDGACEIIVVDDGSSDDTREVAGRFPCKLVVHPVNLGKGEAMKTGVREAQGENIVFIDADNTYPVEAIPNLIAGLEAADMVVASRVRGRHNIPAFNRIGNFIFSNLIRYLGGFKARDPLSGLYGIKKAALERMDLRSDGFGIETEIAVKAGKLRLKVTDIGIEYRPRTGRQKLAGVGDGWKILKTIFREIFRSNIRQN